MDQTRPEPRPLPRPDHDHPLRPRHAGAAGPGPRGRSAPAARPYDLGPPGAGRPVLQRHPLRVVQRRRTDRRLRRGGRPERHNSLVVPADRHRAGHRPRPEPSPPERTPPRLRRYGPDLRPLAALGPAQLGRPGPPGRRRELRRGLRVHGPQTHHGPGAVGDVGGPVDGGDGLDHPRPACRRSGTPRPNGPAGSDRSRRPRHRRHVLPQLPPDRRRGRDERGNGGISTASCVGFVGCGAAGREGRAEGRSGHGGGPGGRSPLKAPFSVGISARRPHIVRRARSNAASRADSYSKRAGSVLRVSGGRRRRRARRRSGPPRIRGGRPRSA